MASNLNDVKNNEEDLIVAKMVSEKEVSFPVKVRELVHVLNPFSNLMLPALEVNNTMVVQSISIQLNYGR